MGVAVAAWVMAVFITGVEEPPQAARQTNEIVKIVSRENRKAFITKLRELSGNILATPT
jgi:hypothetical protein